ESPIGSTPRTFAAARAGALLGGLSLNFISIVLESVMQAVPTTPAARPLPTAAGHAEGLSARLREEPTVEIRSRMPPVLPIGLWRRKAPEVAGSSAVAMEHADEATAGRRHYCRLQALLAEALGKLLRRLVGPDRA